MNRYITIILLILASSTHAADSFDPTTNQLTIPSVVVSGIPYQNVLVKLNNFSVVSIGSKGSITCSNATLQGMYLYSYTSTKEGVPFSEVGFEYYDGKGNIVDKSADSGVQAIDTSLGTYSINPDCTGVSTYSANENYNIFVSPDGDSFTFIEYDPGTVVSGVEKRVSAVGVVGN